jgi:hypothetical protein
MYPTILFLHASLLEVVQLVRKIALLEICTKKFSCKNVKLNPPRPQYTLLFWLFFGQLEPFLSCLDFMENLTIDFTLIKTSLVAYLT